MVHIATLVVAATAALSTTTTSAAAVGTGDGNPFAAAQQYVNPSYQAELETSIATATGTVKETLQHMREIPSAYWLDVKSKVKSGGGLGAGGANTTTAAGILADAASQSPAPLVTFIVYDLPNRDCRAKASNGEICCTANADGTCNYNAGGTCEVGLKEYQTEYIDELASVLRAVCFVEAS